MPLLKKWLSLKVIFSPFHKVLRHAKLEAYKYPYLPQRSYEWF